jgi:hypothetical protein
MERAFSYGEWFRVGHGKERQFFALEAELDQWLSDGLPKEFWPYQLLTEDMEKVGREYFERLVRCDGLSISQCRAGTDRISFWVASRRISSEALKTLNNPKNCSINGFILVQWRERKGALDFGRIAITGKIRHAVTGETVEHAEYLKIFRALEKRIKADLKYSTLRGPEDSAFEDKKLALMTARAAEAAKEGRVKFTRRPGALLR